MSEFFNVILLGGMWFIFIITMVGIIAWGARSRVRAKNVKTFREGVIMEIGGFVFCAAGVVLISSSFMLEGQFPYQRSVQFFCSSIMCLTISHLFFRQPRREDGKWNRSTWIGVGILFLALYLFLRGWALLAT